jgi:uncharacterized phage protein (TIGR01671 family)
MSREIKLRVWSKEGEAMIEWEDLLDAPDLLEFLKNQREDGYYSGLMQFTGLNDKKKCEIFVGDIIDGSYINPMTKEIVKRHYLVIFENGYYIAKLIGKSPYGDTLLYFINEKCEVIGNIYENPELLEGEFL